MLLTPLLVLVTLAFSVEAGLSRRMLVPENAHRVALDEINKRLIAFDDNGLHLGDYHMNAALPTKRADGDQCERMMEHDLDDLPGLSQLRRHVENYFPTDIKYKIVVNDRDLPVHQSAGHKAEICISKGFPLKLNENSECSHVRVDFFGSHEGDRIVMSSKSGIHALPSITITEQSAFMKKEKIILRSFPSILNVPWSKPGPIDVNTLMDIDLTNEVGNRLEVQSKPEMHWQTVVLRADHTPSCKIFRTPQNCEAVGSGELKIYAKGWLWFEYDDKVGRTDDNKHWKWAFNMDKIVRQDDRSSPIKFKVSGKMPFSDLFAKEGCSDDDFLKPWPGIMSYKPSSYNPFQADNEIKLV